jgi:hypothetical protein
MHTLRILAALSVATLLGACPHSGPTNAASSNPCTAPMAMGASGSMAEPDSRLKAMQEMHQKMVNARSPADRQALMADHMKAIHGGMAMMKEMHAMHAMHGSGGMGMMGSSGSAAPMGRIGDGSCMSTDMAKRHQMMVEQMAMLPMLLDMMADQMPPASTGK